MIRIEPKQLHDGNLLSCEASDIGLPPGKWPPSITVNGKIFFRARINADDEVESVLYRNGIHEVIVFND